MEPAISNRGDGLAGWLRRRVAPKRVPPSPQWAEDVSNGPGEPSPLVLAEAPEELTQGRLERLGEGVGKVVYASPHWVVKRERSSREVIALIAIWKVLRALEHIIPGRLGKRLLQRPAGQIRFLRVMMQGAMLVVPRSIWLMTHLGDVWRIYHSRGRRGESLAQKHLEGTSLVPERISFPPVRVNVGGWPGWLTVSEATERVECTLHEKLSQLSSAGNFDELEEWLNRFLDLRQRGWQRGLFSVDAHLKNFGVTGSHIVLLDSGGLTDRWEEIEQRLASEKKVSEPHVALGLGRMLQSRPGIADRFNERWRSIVNREEVLRHWPDGPAG